MTCHDNMLRMMWATLFLYIVKYDRGDPFTIQKIMSHLCKARNSLDSDIIAMQL